MKLSYLLFVHNETDTLQKLLDVVFEYSSDEDEIIISDDYSSTEETIKILYSVKDKCKYIKYKLEDGYANKKNKALLHCKGEYVFAIDGDERPELGLIINIKDIIQSNKGIDLFWVSRINDFRGVTEEHAKHWGWRLSMSKKYGRPVVNAPDYQGRIFVNDVSRVYWEGRLHERIVGHKNYVFLPAEEDLALYHDKTIEKQVDTNLKYNKDFTVEENQGFKLPK